MADFKKIGCLAVVFLTAALCLPPSLRGASEPPVVRVAIVRDVAEITLAVEGAFDILSYPSGEKLRHENRLKAVKVSACAEGICFPQKKFARAAVRVVSRKKAAILVNRRPYRGDIVITKTPAGLLTVINLLDLESYVKGVLPQEISPKWPIDAIKAQAVAARTYALYQKETSASRLFDLAADTSSQVYGGFASERNKSNRAVNFTYGEVLLYQGKGFPAYFHATCGGMTERAAELWKISLEPLSGTRLCSYCSESPHYYWEASLDLKSVRKKMGAVYRLKGDLKNIRVTERNISGRVRGLELRDAQGKTQLVSAKDFRHALGPDVIRSTNFIINLEGEKATFNGKGWGHGVGLCQWGALGMSQKGYSYAEILEFYYPGSQIKKIY
ncbi:MAG: SpoIID/LytB domain-containing protein [Candidatus Omnitrophota bacterium]